MPKIKEGDVVNGTRVWGDTKARKCSLCLEEFHGMGNNPEPLKPFKERCCDRCNNEKVIPARLAAMGYSTKTANEIGQALNSEKMRDAEAKLRKGVEGKCPPLKQ